MKLMRILLPVVILVAANFAQAGYRAGSEDYDIVDVATEVFLLRPVGFIGTVLGGVFFIATSPLSAFATLAPPHDAIARAGRVFFLAPAAYTFQRPFGAYRYDALGDYGRDLQPLPPEGMP